MGQRYSQISFAERRRIQDLVGSVEKRIDGRPLTVADAQQKARNANFDEVVICEENDARSAIINRSKFLKEEIGVN